MQVMHDGPTSADGLSAEEAASRLKLDGFNELPSSAKKGGVLGTGPRLGTTDLKDGDSSAGRVPIGGETGATATDPSSFSTNTGVGETGVA